MKSCMCVWLIAVSLVTPVAFAEIVYDEDHAPASTSAYTNVTAYANGYDSEDSVGGWGWQSYWTTTEGYNFHWYYDVYAYVCASLTIVDGKEAQAMAAGSASGWGPDGSSRNKDAYIYLDSDESLSDEDPKLPDVPGDHWSGDGHLFAGYGVHSSQNGGAGAGVYPGSGDTAYAHACIQAWCSLSGY